MSKAVESAAELSLKAFAQEEAAFDEAVMATPDIATFCSGSDWLHAANEALHEDRRILIRRDGAHWLAFACGPISPFVRVFQPMEFAWGFGCPLVGPTLEGRLELLLRTLEETRGQWQLALIGGVPMDSDFWSTLLMELSGDYYVEILEGTHCIQADISDGAEAFLARRNGRFRSNIRRAVRRAEKEGVEFEWYAGPVEDGEALFERALEVEQYSWKYQDGKSIFLIPRYQHFYGILARRLGQKGNFRMLFARHEGRDIAYVFGGVLGDVYRGFQLSYHNTYSHLSLGHLIQWEMIQRLAAEGIGLYDLGMAMDYKRRWADQTLRLANVAIFPA